MKTRSTVKSGPGCLLLVGLIAFWQMIALTGAVRPIFLSSPLAVVLAPATMNLSELWSAALTSAASFIQALFLSGLVGISAGILIGASKSLTNLTRPLIALAQATPRIALAPLLILWLGVGTNAVIALIFMNAVIPILVTTLLGVQAAQKRWIECATVFGASFWQRLRTIHLPASLPFAVAGLRLGTGRALLSLVVGEFLTGSNGLGALIRQFANAFQTDRMLFGIALFALTGVILDWFFAKIDERLYNWRGQ